MNRKQRWQDWVMLVLAVWLFFSPFFLGYESSTGIAASDSYVLGVLVAIFSIAALANPQNWEEWINVVLGIWLIIAPFVLQFRTDQVAMANHIVLGILIAGDALWALAQRPAAGTHQMQ